MHTANECDDGRTLCFTAGTVHTHDKHTHDEFIRGEMCGKVTIELYKMTTVDRRRQTALQVLKPWIFKAISGCGWNDDVFVVTKAAWFDSTSFCCLYSLVHAI